METLYKVSICTILEMSSGAIQEMNNIQSISTKAGSGKTTWALNEIITNPKPTIYCVPSTKLIDELLKKNSNFEPFDGRYCKTQAVSSALAGRMKKSNGLLITTHEAFKNFKDWHLAKNWRLFHDETFNPFQAFTFNYYDTFNIGTRLPIVNVLNSITTQTISFDDRGQHGSNLIHFVVNPIFHKQLSKVKMMKTEDKFEESYSEFFGYLDNSNYSIWCDQDDWIEFSKGNRKNISIMAEFKLSCFEFFEESIIMAARFYETEMAFAFDLQNLFVSPNRSFHYNTPNPLDPDPFYPAHKYMKVVDMTHKNPIEIHWAYDKDLWSINFAQENNHVVKYLDEASKITGCHTLLQINNKFKSTLNHELQQAQMIPSNCHGLNDFSSYDKVILSGAFNYTPEFMRLLTKKSLKKEVDQLLMNNEHLLAMQSILRCCVRLNESNSAIILVPHRGLAEWIQKEIFPNAKLFAMSGFITNKKKNGRPLIGIKPLTNTEMNKRFREKYRNVKY